MATFKRISQSTFDDVVRENVEDFEMPPAEALQEAISQLRTQGVDLANLDLTGGIGRQELLEALSTLIRLAQSASSWVSSQKDIMHVLQRLRKFCDQNHILNERNIMLAKEKGGVNALHLLLDIGQSEDVVIMVCDYLTELSTASGE